ncbi:zinc-ribbon domain-containing protein [Treponema sp.]
MFCKYCGNQILENSNFCSKCGNKLTITKSPLLNPKLTENSGLL